MKQITYLYKAWDKCTQEWHYVQAIDRMQALEKIRRRVLLINGKYNIQPPIRVTDSVKEFLK
jgi:bacterioferritin (cytochrome b1)